MTTLRVGIILFIVAHYFVSAIAQDGPLNKEVDHHRPIVNKKTLTYEKLHGFLLWASIGFIMPIAIILVRLTKRAREQGCTRRLEILYYLHVTLQSLAVVLASVGAILSLVKFNTKFWYAHQRLGLCLYIIVWLQPLLGFLRPERGMQGRSFWYFLHWILGTGGAILGMVNTYTGFHSYETFNSRSLKTVRILFSIQVSFIALFYLLQDRWDYLLEQTSPKPKSPLPKSLDSEKQAQPQQSPSIEAKGNSPSQVTALDSDAEQKV